MKTSRQAILRFEFAKAPASNPGAVVLHLDSGQFEVHYEWFTNGKWSRSNGAEEQDLEAALYVFQHRVEREAKWFQSAACLNRIEQFITASPRTPDHLTVMKFDFAEVRPYPRDTLLLNVNAGRYFVLYENDADFGQSDTSYEKMCASFMHWVNVHIQRLKDPAGFRVEKYVEPYPIG